MNVAGGTIEALFSSIPGFAAYRGSRKAAVISDSYGRVISLPDKSGGVNTD